MAFVESYQGEIYRSSSDRTTRIAGLPFILGGAVMIANCMGFVLPGGEPLPLIAGVVGGIIGFLGVALSFASFEFLVDPSRQLVQKSVQFLWYHKKEQFFFSELSEVTLSMETRSNDNGSSTVYPVRFSRVNDSKPIDIHVFQSLSEARAMAERMSRLVQLPLADVSSGTKSLREHDKLDTPLREAIVTSGAELASPSRPIQMRSQLENRGSALKVTIPPSGFQSAHGVLFAILILPAVIGIPTVDYFTGGMLFEGSDTGVFRFLPWLFLGVPLLGVIGYFGLQALARTTVEVSQDGIIVSYQRLFWVLRKEISGNDLEELLLVTRESLVTKLQEQRRQAGVKPAEAPTWLRELFGANVKLVAQSDAQSLSFGAYLSDEELTYLHSQIQKAIAGS